MLLDDPWVGSVHWWAHWTDRQEAGRCEVSSNDTEHRVTQNCSSAGFPTDIFRACQGGVCVLGPPRRTSAPAAGTEQVRPQEFSPSGNLRSWKSLPLGQSSGWTWEEGRRGQGRKQGRRPLTHGPHGPSAPGTSLALKQLPKSSTSLRGFLYEFCVGLALGAHPAIVAAYGIGIESADSYSFLSEPVLHGDLIAFIQPKVSERAGASLELTAVTQPVLSPAETCRPPQARWARTSLVGWPWGLQTPPAGSPSCWPPSLSLYLLPWG